MATQYLLHIGLVAACLLLCACAVTPATPAGRALDEARMQLPPRKVIVGAVVQGFWGEYPGLEARVKLLTDLVERVHAESRARYGRNADLVALPEEALTCGRKGTARERSLAFEGRLREHFAELARRHRSYLVLPLDLLENDACYNAAILLDRAGNVQGIYRKVHMVFDPDTRELEGGMTATWDVPVFDCDFGRLGIQICWDMVFDHNWQVLEDKGADLVVWPTAAPNTARPRGRAMDHGYYILSSTWRDNAALFEPTGVLAAQVESPGTILVHEIDLSYAVIGWSPQLGDGQAFIKRFGQRIGYRYYPREDCGIFWSNDPALTIGQAVKELGLTPLRQFEAGVRAAYRDMRKQAGQGPPRERGK